MNRNHFIICRSAFSDDPSKSTAEQESSKKDQPLDDEFLLNLHQKENEAISDRNGFPIIPILSVFFVSALVFFGSLHIARSFENSSSIKLSESDQNAVADPQAIVKKLIHQGNTLFKNSCQACHQANGEGLPGVFPPLKDSEWVKGDPDHLIKIILLGLQGPIVVKGDTYNGVMPGYGSSWTDQKIAAVATWVRQAWGNKSEPILKESVTKIRAGLGGRTTQLKAEELK